jgi:hypothetical protein
MNPPRLRAYPRETVVAEKLEAMVKLGLTNSRMKDFYDISVLARTFSFNGSVLSSAIAATFARRETPIPGSAPVALTEVFGEDQSKRTQWDAFRKRNGLTDRCGALDEVIAELATFLSPPLAAAGETAEFNRSWNAGGPWR